MPPDPLAYRAYGTRRAFGTFHQNSAPPTYKYLPTPMVSAAYIFNILEHVSHI